MNIKLGFGRIVMKKGHYYEGDWKNNIRIGEGYEIHRNGCAFKGYYKDDKVLKGSLYIPKP